MARDSRKRNEIAKAKKQEIKETEQELKEKERLQKINKILMSVPLMNWAWPRIGVAVLKERSVSYADKVLDSLLQIHMMVPYSILMNYSRTDLSRNKLAIEVIKDPTLTHILMLDIDHKHPIDIVQRLAKWVLLDPEVKIVGGLNFRRSYPHDPCCHLLDTDGVAHAPAMWDQGLMEVSAIGTGSILIHREVFENIQPPWFFNTYDKVWDDVWPGEDMGFSQKCREYGYKMFVDTTTTSPHIGEYEIGEANFRQAIKQGDLEIHSLEGVNIVS